MFQNGIVKIPMLLGSCSYVAGASSSHLNVVNNKRLISKTAELNGT